MSDSPIRQEILNASSYLNSYSPFIPWSSSIGLKPNLIKYGERNRRSSLAEDYLINSYYMRGDTEKEISIEYFNNDASRVTQSLNNQRDYTDLPIIGLPDSIALDLSLGESILKRRSISQFTGDVVNLSYLATIARCGRGTSNIVMTQSQKGEKINLDFSTVSSAGHLYPVDIYFLAVNIKELKQGIYHYSERKDALIKTGNQKNMLELLNAFMASQNRVIYSRCNYICLFVAHPWKSMSKYGERGLRFVLQEIGSISQNIHLANVSLGLGSVDWGSYYENEVNQIMGFDGVNQSVLHIILAGIAN